MQLVAMPGSRRSLASGHEVAEIPMLHPNLRIRMHTIATGTGGVWAGCDIPTVLVVLEGIGKVTIDGSAQRLTGQCAVSVPPISAVRIANQGAMQMRVLEVSSQRHEDVSEANALWNRPRQS